MKKNKRLLQTITLAALSMVVFIGGCKDSGTGANDDVVIPIQAITQTTVNLKTSGNYVILAGSGITNNPTSSITGNIGLSPASASFITGFSLVYTSGDQSATSVQITGNVQASDYASPTPVNLTTAQGKVKNPPIKKSKKYKRTNNE